MMKRYARSAFILIIILGGMSVFAAAEPGRSFFTIGPASAASNTATLSADSGVMCYDFEDGQFPLDLQIEGDTYSGYQGRAEISSNAPYSGQYALQLDTACTGACGAETFTTQAAVFNFDILAGVDTSLSFWAREFFDETHPEDGVFIRGEAAADFAPIFDFAALDGVYRQVTVELDAAADGQGQSLGQNFQLKFQSFDNHSIPFDGYAIDQICVCQEPQQIIDVQASVNGPEIDLIWNGTAGKTFEVWSAVNEPYFEPGEDCANPAPYQCQATNEPQLTISREVDHPEFNYTFAVVERNLCGQRTTGSRIGRQTALSFSLNRDFPAELAVGLIAPDELTYGQPADLYQVLTWTVHYTNTSNSFTAQTAVLTQTLPAQMMADLAQSTSGWTQVDSSPVYKYTIGVLGPGESGAVQLAGYASTGLPAAARSEVVIGDLAEIDPYPANNFASAYTLLTAVPDRDGDNLPDWLENGSYVFNGFLSPGTSPDTADTDGDGLPDGLEVRGSAAGLDLPLMGVNPLRKNILLEYDWFETDLDCGFHSLRPTPASLDMISAAFAGSPVANPDGSTGIDLIHDYGQGGPFTGGNLIPDPDGVIAGGVAGAEYQGYKAVHFAANRLGYFHYVMLPHRYNTNSNSSGQAEMPGDDMIVSLMCFATDRNLAHTIMHELGHNLGLHHGGFEGINYKPNYNSVMNYRYQFSGVDNNCTPPGDGVLDFSRGQYITLDENNLSESQGICGSVPWDWNDSGSAADSGLAFDINQDSQLSVLSDHDDWANLRFLGTSGGGALGPLQVEITSEPPLPDWVINEGPADR